MEKEKNIKLRENLISIFVGLAIILMILSGVTKILELFIGTLVFLVAAVWLAASSEKNNMISKRSKQRIKLISNKNTLLKTMIYYKTGGFVFGFFLLGLNVYKENYVTSGILLAILIILYIIISVSKNKKD
ncbi:hypothetical protein K9M18_00135 [Candidatus Woesearchaeota archaeon]|nr:hypothetical protein [Candidatus Woesearchaeota archaeon]